MKGRRWWLRIEDRSQHVFLFGTSLCDGSRCCHRHGLDHINYYPPSASILDTPSFSHFEHGGCIDGDNIEKTSVSCSRLSAAYWYRQKHPDNGSIYSVIAYRRGKPMFPYSFLYSAIRSSKDACIAYKQGSIKGERIASLLNMKANLDNQKLHFSGSFHLCV